MTTEIKTIYDLLEYAKGHTNPLFFVYDSKNDSTNSLYMA